VNTVALALLVGLLAIAFAILRVAFYLNAMRLQFIEFGNIAFKWYGPLCQYE
jgi:vacuolar-type H+-ATPase subunit I/STV1